MSMNFVFGGLSIIGVVAFLFFYWRRLKEDYASQVIFISAFYILTGLVIGGLLGGFIISPRLSTLPVFEPSGLWFWGAILGGLLAYLLVVFRLKMRAFETFEAASVGLIFWYSSLFLMIQSYLGFFILLGLFALFLVLDSRYKKFTWYKSGRVGFSGLTTMGTLFLIRALVAFVEPSMLSFAGKADAIASAVVAFLLFFAVYNLSELQ